MIQQSSTEKRHRERIKRPVKKTPIRVIPKIQQKDYDRLKDEAIAEYRRIASKPGEYIESQQIVPIICSTGGILVVRNYPNKRKDKVFFSADGYAYRNRVVITNHMLNF